MTTLLTVLFYVLMLIQWVVMLQVATFGRPEMKTSKKIKIYYLIDLLLLSIPGGLFPFLLFVWLTREE